MSRAADPSNAFYSARAASRLSSAGVAGSNERGDASKPLLTSGTRSLSKDSPALQFPAMRSRSACTASRLLAAVYGRQGGGGGLRTVSYGDMHDVVVGQCELCCVGELNSGTGCKDEIPGVSHGVYGALVYLFEFDVA
ncbi:hypothetical protein NDU88_002747 [Pleurodeles waltl]|uniref:Uncharacterized protein n=1 Tax=Pleurodeles waltl TaxID=8319 RepID=A0AAV7NEW1_PLEWA|nr:hypothetical protein NDU88_002747 [Pleurodeles waltl]